MYNLYVPSSLELIYKQNYRSWRRKSSYQINLQSKHAVFLTVCQGEGHVIAYKIDAKIQRDLSVIQE